MAQTPSNLLTPLQALLYESGRPGEVMQLTGRSYHTVYAWRRGARFPEPDLARLLVERFESLTFDGCYEPSIPREQITARRVRVNP